MERRQDSPLHDLYVGRQTIYNHQLGVYSYELLFRMMRADGTEHAPADDKATANIILAALQDIGVERLAGDRPVTINLSQGLFKLAQDLPLPPERVIFDLPAERLATENFMALRRLKQRGYTLALDGFVFAKQWRPIYELVDFIKVDVGATPGERLIQMPGLIAKLGAGPWRRK